MSNGQDFVNAVYGLIGDPYVYGGAGPTQFDCSGLVQYALESIGLKNVPRTSESQWSWVQPISKTDLQPGDLVFSQWPGDDASPGHVAIYAGNGNLIEAPKPGESVHEVPLNSYYQKFVTGYGRVPGLSYGSSGGVTPVSYSPGGGGGGGGTTTTQASFVGSVLNFFGLNVTDDLAKMVGKVFGPITQVFKDFDQALSTAMTALLWIVNPMNWLRIFAGIIGAVSVIVGAVLVATAG